MRFFRRVFILCLGAVFYCLVFAKTYVLEPRAICSQVACGKIPCCNECSFDGWLVANGNLQIIGDSPDCEMTGCGSCTHNIMASGVTIPLLKKFWILSRRSTVEKVPCAQRGAWTEQIVSYLAQNDQCSTSADCVDASEKFHCIKPTPVNNAVLNKNLLGTMRLIDECSSSWSGDTIVCPSGGHSGVHFQRFACEEGHCRGRVSE